MNTTLTPAALAAIDRIKTFRSITDRSGILTINKQMDVILALENELDALTVIEATKFSMRGAR